MAVRRISLPSMPAPTKVSRVLYIIQQLSDWAGMTDMVVDEKSPEAEDREAQALLAGTHNEGKCSCLHDTYGIHNFKY